MALTSRDFHDSAPIPDEMFEGADVYRPPERRRAIFEIDGDIFVALFKPGRRAYEVCEGAIPDGARLVGVRFDYLRDCWQVCLEHESFDVVPEHALPPTILPVTRILELGDDG